MQRQFLHLGIAAQRVEAVTSDAVQEMLWSGAIASDTLDRLSLGEIACSLSHRLAWSLALEQGAEAVLVLEDDAVIAPALAGLTIEVIKALSADILKLDTANTRPIRLGTRLHEPLPGLGFRALYGRHRSTAGYVLTASAMRACLASGFHLEQQVDMYLYGTPMLAAWRTFQAVPALVAQAEMLRTAELESFARSDLESDRQQRRPTDPNHRRRPPPPLHRRVIANWPMIRALLSRDPLALVRPAQRIGFADPSNPLSEPS